MSDPFSLDPDPARPEDTAPDFGSVTSAPAMAVGPRQAVWLTADGEIETLDLRAAAQRAARTPVIVCHAPSVARRLRRDDLPLLDVLELFAFVRPARFCLPTVAGLAAALNLPHPDSQEDQAVALLDIPQHLAAEMAVAQRDVYLDSLIQTLEQAGWPWARWLIEGAPDDKPPTRRGLDIWNRLPEWEEQAPPPPAGNEPVSGEETLARLDQLLDSNAEARPQQRSYAENAAATFLPREVEGGPSIVLAEAGTGVGKTLGYIAPSSVWARKNDGTVWISTYTKNLQRQLDQELHKLYPDPRERAEKAVLRKGRENYLCLLNLEEEASRARQGRAVTAVALMVRWAEATRDGDMVGGDFPSWLIHLFGTGRTLGLADRRGECVYSACAHYRRCYIERVQRKARRAEIVVANHALVMIQAAMADDATELPTRYVFDEGHHIFDAADSAFAAHLNGQEAAELRRWVRGSEGGRQRRARGIDNRIGDLIGGEEKAEARLAAVKRAAAELPGEGWLRRIVDQEPYGPTEKFLSHVNGLVNARQDKPDAGYSIETETTEPTEAMVEAADDLAQSLQALFKPMLSLAQLLAARLDEEAETLDSDSRRRIDAAARGLRRRAEAVKSWFSMLGNLGRPLPPEFVDWFGVERMEGRSTDVGMYRHWLDPTTPFSQSVLHRAHGVLVTSASLRDRTTATDDEVANNDVAGTWASAEVRTGAHHMPLPARRVSLPSPYDYGDVTRVLVVNDVRRNDTDQVAAAYRELFVAAGGGGLGLFTAIARLRATQAKLVGPLEEAGISLLSQHTDALDTGTLVDIFRAEEDACLLGTDAVRDGVDVPGRSLRLIVFDRVPWPRPGILHRARKSAFGGTRYDDMLTRLRLKQAFGRLIRGNTDRGVFVMLDSALPTRLLDAFPEQVEVQRLGLADAVTITRDFLGR
jgi:ATP-dependent DNA helicase DinG